MPAAPCYPSKCCSDCLMLLANGETDPSWTEEETKEYLERVERNTKGFEITIGKGAEYHACTGFDPDGEIADECECENEGFSWSSCDVCRSNLGGDRFAVTFWIPDNVS